MSKQETKKQKQELVQKEKTAEDKNVEKLMERLDELRKRGTVTSQFARDARA